MSVSELSVPRPPVIEAEPVEAPTPSPAWRKLGVGALTVLGALLYLLGWLAGSLLIPLIFAFRWGCAAIATGWDDAAMSWRNGKA